MRTPIAILAGLALSSFALAACGEETTAPDAPHTQASTPALAVARDTWLIRASMPSTQGLFVVATVPNAMGQSVVYVIGGKLMNSDVSLSRVQAYNVATDTWRRRADLPTALRKQNGATVIDGRIYVPGGITGYAKLTAFLYVYDPATNHWTRKRDMPVPGAQGASGVIRGKLYVLTSGYFFRYNPATDRWITLPAPGSHRYAAGTVLNDKFYAIGDGALGYRDVVVYDPATNRWTTKASPPELGLQIGYAIPLWSKMYVIGFVRHDPEESGAEVGMVTWVYDSATDTWSALTPPPRTVFAGSKVFVSGRPRIEAITGADNLQYIP
jgi:N-acetylneuraminic acid mutarotase